MYSLYYVCVFNATNISHSDDIWMLLATLIMSGDVVREQRRSNEVSPPHSEGSRNVIRLRVIRLHKKYWRCHIY